MTPDVPWWITLLLLPAAGWLGIRLDRLVANRQRLAEQQVATAARERQAEQQQEHDADAELRRAMLEAWKSLSVSLDTMTRTMVAVQFEMQVHGRKLDDLLKAQQRIDTLLATLQPETFGRRATEPAERLRPHEEREADHRE